jgi:hypothetical protein
MLGGPVLAFEPSFWLLWTLSLLLQLRLADDVSALDHDRRVHPERALSGWNGPSLHWFLLGLGLLNAIPLWNRNILLSILYLGFLLLLSPRFPAFAKYAGLVALIDTAVGSWRPETLFHAGLVAIAASAFELGHDRFSSSYSRLLYAGLVLLPCLSLGWTPRWLDGLVIVFCVVALLRLLSSYEISPKRRFLCAASSYLSVALISGTLFAWKGFPCTLSKTFPAIYAAPIKAMTSSKPRMI